MSSILFPLRTNIKSLQRWGDNYDISGRIKQSIILYDTVIVETGTFTYSGSERAVLHGFEQWSEENTREAVLKKSKEIEERQEESYITYIDGKTGIEKWKYKVEKKDEFIADYRTVDVISEIESGSYGEEVDFLNYAFILRKKNHNDVLVQNTLKDLANKKFAERARKIYGQMPLIELLNNLNDSLAMSHLFKMPVAVDAMHAPLLRIKTEYEVGLQFAILDRLTQVAIPDFSTLDLDSLLQYRKDKAIKSFRNLIWKMNSKLQSKGTLGIDELFIQELLQEIREIAPTKKKIVLKTALGVLSFIPVPLASIATTIGDIGKELKEYRDFATNWLSFVLKAREED